MLSRTKQLTSVFLQASSLFHRADAHTPSAAQPSGALPANGLVRNQGPRVCVCVCTHARVRLLAFIFRFKRHMKVIFPWMKFYECDVWPIASCKHFRCCPQAHQQTFVFPLCIQRTCSDSSSQVLNLLSASVFSLHGCFLRSLKLYAGLSVLLLNTTSIKAGISCGVVRLFTSWLACVCVIMCGCVSLHFLKWKFSLQWRTQSLYSIENGMIVNILKEKIEIIEAAGVINSDQDNY